jgi:hypothetical protein
LRSFWGSLLTASIWLNKWIIWSCLVLALAGANFTVYTKVSDASGVIYVTQDTSSSMGTGESNPEEVKLAGVYDPKLSDPKSAVVPARIDVSLGAIKLFIQHSHGLRIGLSAFDDQFFYLYPATKDDVILTSVLDQIKDYIETHSTGTNFDGPLPNGYETDGALQGAVNIFEGEPSDVVHIWIMVTDGDSTIDADRAAQLKSEFDKLKIHMFVFGVGDEWGQGSSDLEPLTDFVKSVGGQSAPVEDPKRFEQLTEAIDQLAQSSVHDVRQPHSQNALLVLLAIAGGAFIVNLLLTAFRRSSL